MNNKFLRALQIYLMIMDFVFINIMFFACQFIFLRHKWIVQEPELMYFCFLIGASWIVVVLAMSIYSDTYILSFESFTKRTIQGYVVFLLVTIITVFFLKWDFGNRVFPATVLSLVFAVLIIDRFIYLGFRQYLRSKHWLVNKVVILGEGELALRLADYLEEDTIDKEVAGFIENGVSIANSGDYPVLGKLHQTIEICRANNISEIYSTLVPEQYPELYDLIQLADQNLIRFKFVPDLHYFMKGTRVYVDYLNELPVFHLRREPLQELDSRIKKRILDIIISSLVIVFILSWLVPLIGLLIKLESRGPIFFAQRRSGKDNRPFYCLKFRSMQVNAEAHTLQATKNDSRVTKVGAFLRRTSLDEFPQFVNVLKGQMSIVGPRPHMLKHTDEYSQQIDTFMIRHFLKPGITGWAQVNGYRGETYSLNQMEKRVEYDLWYLENWSLLVDIKIMFMTAFNSMKGEKNAY